MLSGQYTRSPILFVTYVHSFTNIILESISINLEVPRRNCYFLVDWTALNIFHIPITISTDSAEIPFVHSLIKFYYCCHIPSSPKYRPRARVIVGGRVVHWGWVGVVNKFVYM